MSVIEPNSEYPYPKGHTPLVNESELREQVAREIEALPKFKSTDRGMVEDDFGHYIYIDEVLQALRGKGNE